MINFSLSKIKKKSKVLLVTLGLSSLLVVLFTNATDPSRTIATSCAATTTSLKDWRSDLKTFLISGAGKTFCFAPGVYNGQVVISNVSNVRLLAPQGGASFEYNMPTIVTNPAVDYVSESTFALSDSSNVILENLTIKNTGRYADNVTHKTSRALQITSSIGIKIISSFFQSFGKQTLNIYKSDVDLQNSYLECYYFCLIAQSANVTVENSRFTVNHLQDLKDGHTAFWVGDTTGGVNLTFNNSTFNYVTGNGFLSGSNLPENKVEINYGQIINPGKMANWLQTHPNYKNLRLFVTGNFPSTIWPYHCISWENPSCTYGWERGTPHLSEVFIRTGATTDYSLKPLPPMNPDQIFFFNAYPVGGAMMIQKIIAGVFAFKSTYWKNWSDVPAGSYGGWLDPNDRILSGDFLGDGKTQLLFINADSSIPNAGAFRMQEFNATTNSFENVYWKNWSDVPAGSYGGWLAPNNRILSGDFLGDGKTQLLFINADSSIPNAGAFRMQEFNATTNSFENVYWKNWSDVPAGSYGGWLDPNNRILSIGAFPL